MQVELKNVTKYYGNLKALDGINLVITEGATGLLGPNGAGKSTLIKTLLGLVKFQSGTGSVLGLDIRNQSRAIRAKVGYFPEDDCYIVGMTGVESVTYAGELCGMPSRESLRRAHELLDYVGVNEERYRDIQQYSYGMKQKIKLAQALMHDPKLLFLDEPTNGLDPQTRDRTLQMIKTLSNKKGISIVLSSHNLHEVERVCNSIIIIGQGKILAQDTLENLQKPIEPSYTIRLHGVAANLIKELQDGNFKVEVLSEDTIKVFGDGDIPNLVMQKSITCGCQIRQVLPSKNSLEDIFLKAVG